MLTQPEVIDLISALDTTPDIILAACRKVADAQINPSRPDFDFTKLFAHLATDDSEENEPQKLAQIILATCTKDGMHPAVFSIACLYAAAASISAGIRIGAIPQASQRLTGLLAQIFREMFDYRLHEYLGTKGKKD